jgi:uncharacterized OB-fold protein
MASTTPLLADYRPRVVDDRVAGGRCTSCGYATAPMAPRCPNCGGVSAPASFPLSGRVWSATVIHIPVGEHQPPFGLAYVDIDDGPRVLAHSTDENPLEVGAQVTIREIGDDLVATPAEEEER